MNAIWNPHDRLFKQLWRERNVVADFLRTYLPGDVSSLISAGSVELCKDSFVSADLKEYFSDLLYRADMGGRPGYLYVLLEHKSRPAPLVPLQLLGYIKGIWDLHLKQSPLPLPMVVPVVLYHGRENWRVPCCLSGLLEDHWEGLTRYVPDFEYHLKFASASFAEDTRQQACSRIAYCKRLITP